MDLKKLFRRRTDTVLGTLLLMGLLVAEVPSVAAAARGVHPGERGQLRKLRLVPPQVTLFGAGASHRFVVLGQSGDGLERDVTSQARFRLVDSGPARVEATGTVVSVAKGETVLEASLGDLKGEARVVVREPDRALPFHFARDVEEIFTRHGCNASDCHGGVKGRGGFKLSLNGLIPAEDFQWIVRGGVYQVLTPEVGQPQIPRIDQDEPARSLLLLKPTMSIPHVGGRRFEVGSEDYRTLVKWIRDGAPYGRDEGRRITRLETLPSSTVLQSGESRQILVRAHLANGRVEDVTDRVRFLSNNREIIAVDDRGVVRGMEPGEDFVLIRAPGQVATVRIGVVDERGSVHPQVPRNNFIDAHVFEKLGQLKIRPSDLSDDAEFLRRACLALTGTLPPPDRVREFLASQDPKKRSQLIEILLASPEYVDYWTFRFAQLFRVRSSAGHPEHAYPYWFWIRKSVSENRPYDQMARERVAGEGYQGPSRHYPMDDPLPADVMAENVRVFLGRRLDCAQCHNHPFENWTQDQFWGLAGFFGNLSRTEWPGYGATVIFDDPEGNDPDYDTPVETVQVLHPRTKQVVSPAFLDGTPLAAEARSDPRMRLAEWITDHPFFAEASVNRFWGMLFGRGLVDPIDDFQSDNPPTHPELLAELARDFRDSGYDLKHLLRRMVHSRTFQLDSQSNPSNRRDRTNYSRFLPQPLEAEILLDAISQVTGVPAVLENSKDGQAPLGTRAIGLIAADVFPSHFLKIFGRPSRKILPEHSGAPSLNQALHMLVGAPYTEWLSRPDSLLDQLVKDDLGDRQVIEELYLAALGRFSTPGELTRLERSVAAYGSRQEAFEDLLWALLTSREFAYNH